MKWSPSNSSVRQRATLKTEDIGVEAHDDAVLFAQASNLGRIPVKGTDWEKDCNLIDDVAVAEIQLVPHNRSPTDGRPFGNRPFLPSHHPQIRAVYNHVPDSRQSCAQTQQREDWCRESTYGASSCRGRGSAPVQFGVRAEMTHRTEVLMTQNSARNGRVIIRTLNAEPIATKHTMERVVAFDMSFISTRLLDSLIDLYRPQMERMRWQMNNAIRKMMQFNILVLIERELGERDVSLVMDDNRRC